MWSKTLPGSIFPSSTSGISSSMYARTGGRSTGVSVMLGSEERPESELELLRIGVLRLG